MRRIFTIIIILFLIFSFFNISLTSKTLKDNSKIKNCNIIYVDDDNVLGPWNGTINYPYKKINNAIENLTFGQDIFVFNGTYNEILTIEKQVKIQGENKFSTIIDGFYKSNIIEIRVENVRISNFTIRNSAGYKDNAGLLINNGNNSIDNCIFYNTKTSNTRLYL